MSNKEISTSIQLDGIIYKSSNETFAHKPNAEISQSNFIDIDFPKSRSVKFTDQNQVIRVSVNYEKIDTQMRNFNSNTSTF